MRFGFTYLTGAAATCLPKTFHISSGGEKVLVHLSDDELGAVTANRRFVIETRDPSNSALMDKRRAFHDAVDSGEDGRIFGIVRPIDDDSVSLSCKRNTLVVEQFDDSPFKRVDEITSSPCPPKNIRFKGEQLILSQDGKSAKSDHQALLIGKLDPSKPTEFYRSLAFYETATKYPEVAAVVGTLVGQNVDGFCSTQTFAVELRGPFIRMSDLDSVEKIAVAAHETVRTLRVLHKNGVLKNRFSLSDIIVISHEGSTLSTVQMEGFEAASSFDRNGEGRKSDIVQFFTELLDLIRTKRPTLDPLQSIAEFAIEVHKKPRYKKILEGLRLVAVSPLVLKYQILGERFQSKRSARLTELGNYRDIAGLKCPTSEITLLDVGDCVRTVEPVYRCERSRLVNGRNWMPSNSDEEVENLSVVKSFIDIGLEENLQGLIGQMHHITPTSSEACRVRMIAYDSVDSWRNLHELKIQDGMDHLSAMHSSVQLLALAGQVILLFGKIHESGFVATNMDDNMVITDGDRVQLQPALLGQVLFTPFPADPSAIVEELEEMRWVAGKLNALFGKFVPPVVTAFTEEITRLKESSLVRPDYISWASRFADASERLAKRVRLELAYSLQAGSRLWMTRLEEAGAKKCTAPQRNMAFVGVEGKCTRESKKDESPGRYKCGDVRLVFMTTGVKERNRAEWPRVKAVAEMAKWNSGISALIGRCFDVDIRNLSGDPEVVKCATRTIACEHKPSMVELKKWSKMGGTDALRVAAEAVSLIKELHSWGLVTTHLTGDHILIDTDLTVDHQSPRFNPMKLRDMMIHPARNIEEYHADLRTLAEAVRDRVKAKEVPAIWTDFAAYVATLEGEMTIDYDSWIQRFNSVIA